MTRDDRNPSVLRVDARGMLCPWPAVRAAKAIREHAGPIELLADDPKAAAEIAEVAAAANWTSRGGNGVFLLERQRG